MIHGKLVTNNSKYAGIYAVINLNNGKVYIGSSNNLYTRKKSHFNDLKKNNHTNQHLQNAYNIDNKYFIMVEIEKVENVNNLHLREQYWMDELKSYDRTVGYNINQKADSLRFFKHSDEAKRKLREINLGRKLSEEHKKRIGESLKGRTVSQETREKIRLTNIKTKTSPNYKQNKKSTTVIQYSMDGFLIAIWNSIKEAADTLNLSSSNIVNCCNNKRKSTGGFLWAYHKN